MWINKKVKTQLSRVIRVTISHSANMLVTRKTKEILDPPPKYNQAANIINETRISPQSEI